MRELQCAFRGRIRRQRCAFTFQCVPNRCQKFRKAQGNGCSPESVQFLRKWKNYINIWWKSSMLRYVSEFVSRSKERYKIWAQLSLLLSALITFFVNSQWIQFSFSSRGSRIQAHIRMLQTALFYFRLSAQITALKTNSAEKRNLRSQNSLVLMRNEFIYRLADPANFVFHD